MPLPQDFTTSDPAQSRGPAMVAHLFQGGGGGVYCLSTDRTGAKIPTAQSPLGWRYVRDVELFPGDNRLAVDVNLALSELRDRGYHLVGPWYDAI
jgi:hypothetical protein